MYWFSTSIPTSRLLGREDRIFIPNLPIRQFDGKSLRHNLKNILYGFRGEERTLMVVKPKNSPDNMPRNFRIFL